MFIYQRLECQANLILLLPTIGMRAFFFLIAFLIAGPAWPQAVVQVDLKDRWQVFEGDKWEPYTGKSSRAIHFSVDKWTPGSELLILDRKEYALFLDGKLLARQTDSLILNLDSLSVLHPGFKMFSLYQHSPVYSAKTIVLQPTIAGASDEKGIRQGHYFSDFLIIASFLVLLFWVALFRANSRLVLDYLNVIKLFSIQERDEAIVAGRIGSSINLLFFGLISFILALLLMVVFRMAPDRLPWAEKIEYTGIVTAFLVWLVLSAIIFIALFIKLSIIWSFSWLFNVREVVRFQFFNFVRLLFILATLLCFIGVGYFIFLLQSSAPYFFLLILAAILTAVSTVLLFLKLLARTHLPVFHLFSYLCATEIIPLLILGKLILL